MRREEISKELESASFEYFYWFSRFEFALKKNKLLKRMDPGAKAEPSWEAFKEQDKESYKLSDEAKKIIELHPKRQFVNESHELDWKPVGIDHCTNDLCRIITMLNAIRNNLFHGGKHGDIDMDSRERNLGLLNNAKVILDQLVALASFEEDYTRYY